MFDLNLDISSIQAKITEEGADADPIPKETSLQRILDEFDKREETAHLRTKMKRNSAPHIVISKTHHPPLISANTRYALHLPDDQTISSGNKRESQPLILQKALSTDKSPRLALDRLDLFPNSPALIVNAATTRTLGYPKNEDEVKYTHQRRFSNLNDYGILQSQAKLSGVGSTMSGSHPNSLQSPIVEPRFNISHPTKPANQNYGTLTRSPSLTSSIGHGNLPKPLYPNITKNYQKVDNSPRITTINSDYLLKVLSSKHDSGGSTHSPNIPGSTLLDNPTSVGTPRSSDFRIAKRGSFSVFRKIVEAELSKNI